MDQPDEQRGGEDMCAFHETDGLYNTLFGKKKSQTSKTQNGSLQVSPSKEITENPFLGEDFDSACSHQYDFSHARRGTAVIIINCKFTVTADKNERTRKYCDKDMDRLKKTLGKLGFEVKEYWDRSTTEMLTILEDVAGQDHSDEDCFLCVISSHGTWGEVTRPGHSKEYGDVVYGTNATLATYQIVEKFNRENCGTLAGKPKIFLFQACRGTMLQSKVKVEELDSTGRVTKAEAVKHPGSEQWRADLVPAPHWYTVPYKLSVYKDMLMAYSSPPGFLAFNTEDGSPFIQSLCAVLNRDGATVDLLSNLTHVCSSVAIDFESDIPVYGLHERKQMVWVASMLTKEIYFTPKTGGAGDANPEEASGTIYVSDPPTNAAAGEG